MFYILKLFLNNIEESICIQHKTKFAIIITML
jgi:hypothetical protein